MTTSNPTMTETHPLRAALDAAIEVAEQAQAAYDALEDDSDAARSTAAHGIPLCDYLGQASTDADAAVDAAREALVGSDCPRTWKLIEEGVCYCKDFLALSPEEALAEARANTADSDYDRSQTLWIDVHVHCEETDESDSDTVVLCAEEPECLDERGHDWQSPIELVGGIEENPGVWGHGGGVIIHEACVRCGCRRTTDTWAQRRDTGEQGLRSVEYEEGAYTIERGVQLSSADMGDVSEDDFDAWAAYVESHIGERCGFGVDVSQRRFGESGEDVFSATLDGDEATLHEALRALWEDFCADASAWPTAQDASRVQS